MLAFARVSLINAQGGSDPELRVDSLRLGVSSPGSHSGINLNRLYLQEKDGGREQYTGLGLFGEAVFNNWTRLGAGVSSYYGDAGAGLGAGVFTELNLVIPISKRLDLYLLTGLRGDLIYHEQQSEIGSAFVGISWDF